MLLFWLVRRPKGAYDDAIPDGPTFGKKPMTAGRPLNLSRLLSLAKSAFFRGARAIIFSTIAFLFCLVTVANAQQPRLNPSAADAARFLNQSTFGPNKA